MAAETIVVALISAASSLGGIWLQHHLESRRRERHETPGKSLPIDRPWPPLRSWVVASLIGFCSALGWGVLVLWCELHRTFPFGISSEAVGIAFPYIYVLLVTTPQWVALRRMTRRTWLWTLGNLLVFMAFWKLGPYEVVINLARPPHDLPLFVSLRECIYFSANFLIGLAIVRTSVARRVVSKVT